MLNKLDSANGQSAHYCMAYDYSRKKKYDQTHLNYGNIIDIYSSHGCSKSANCLLISTFKFTKKSKIIGDTYFPRLNPIDYSKCFKLFEWFVTRSFEQIW